MQKILILSNINLEWNISEGIACNYRRLNGGWGGWFYDDLHFFCKDRHNISNELDRELQQNFFVCLAPSSPYFNLFSTVSIRAERSKWVLPPPPSLARLARVASKSMYTCTTIYELICMIQSHNGKVHLCVVPLLMTYVYEVPF